MGTCVMLFGGFVVFISVLVINSYAIQAYKKKKQKEKLEERIQWKRNFDLQQKIGSRIFDEASGMSERCPGRFRVTRDLNETEDSRINIIKRGGSGSRDVLVYQVDICTDSCFGTPVGISLTMFKKGEKTTASYNADNEGVQSVLNFLDFALSN